MPTTVLELKRTEQQVLEAQKFAQTIVQETIYKNPNVIQPDRSEKEILDILLPLAFVLIEELPSKRDERNKILEDLTHTNCQFQPHVIELKNAIEARLADREKQEALANDVGFFKSLVKAELNVEIRERMKPNYKTPSNELTSYDADMAMRDHLYIELRSQMEASTYLDDLMRLLPHLLESLQTNPTNREAVETMIPPDVIYLIVLDLTHAIEGLKNADAAIETILPKFRALEHKTAELKEMEKNIIKSINDALLEFNKLQKSIEGTLNRSRKRKADSKLPPAPPAKRPASKHAQGSQ